MIELEIRGIRVRLSFGFFAVWGWLMAGKSGNTAAAALFSCLLHEAGHIAAISLMGIKITRLTFTSGGIALDSGRELMTAGTAGELFILSAGCIANTAAAVICGLMGQRLWALINIALCLFNLLPLSCLDGGRIINALCARFLPLADMRPFQRAGDIAIGIAALIFFILHGNVSFTLPLSMGLIIFEGLAHAPGNSTANMHSRQ